ncbi:unnamed protein product [Pleuronectes platessa]|uniref:Uncharacterized protein n=1 Tax=Pleuronectes platessa TaxID=8262 RepID=A0A9N7Z6R4_PLEPL|nr:unnamed protein product [Pleuronectes platessa]
MRKRRGEKMKEEDTRVEDDRGKGRRVERILSQLLGASRRVPPAVAVAEVIREKGPTRVQSRRRRPPYPVPSSAPPSAPAMDTAPPSKRKKAPAPATLLGATG